MEWEEFHLPLISETVFSFHIQSPICPNIIQDENFHNGYMEKLLQIEAELMDLCSNEEDIVIDSEKVQEFDLDLDLDLDFIQQCPEQVVDLLTQEDNSNFKETVKESSITDLLLLGAEAIEAENFSLASAVIAKLNDLLFYEENGDNPFNRLAMFFTRGLHYKSVNAPELVQEHVLRQSSNMSAFQMLQELSPYVKFAHFTANQAILEATQGDHEVHVIDFDIMEGIQWPPLMADLAARKEVSLRLTAVVFAGQETTHSVQQTRRRLKEFADSINLTFVFDHVVMVKEEDFEEIQVGHPPIANCMFRQLHMLDRSFSMVRTFLGGISKLSPKTVVLVEEELFNFPKIPSMSFVEFFCEALHHYNAVADSLASSFCGGYQMGLRLIEKEFLGTRILDSVRRFPCEKQERKMWADGVFTSLKKFKRIPMSSCNISQAKFLASLFSGGYWVQHEKCRLSLCWKSKPLTSASIWVPL
ncbi:Transcription factor GRAS [Dillenia turbinata]|uniref:Transcription factor GRAS n=1 Tax=Dillenia turbinata TaxID=194707 RepID=A0AAN8Z319_9MAGN